MLSDKFALPWGVLQGSCFGPLLFTIYASKPFEIVYFHLPDDYTYADDAQLSISFRPDGSANQSLITTR